jgi:histidine triad (HIT) family protein
MNCLFCKIVAGTIPSTKVYEDDLAYAFADIDPKAPVHVLVVPKRHLAALSESTADDKQLIGHLHWVANEISRQKNLATGYRTVINTGEDGGQTVSHLHVHLLGGRPMHWPPG